jgi:hypothetical protein
MLRWASEISMTDKIRETVGSTSTKPAASSLRAVWVATAALAVLLISAAAVASDCRSSRTARPWCPDKYTRTFKRLSSEISIPYGPHLM